MDALPAALRSSLGAILMNCQRLGKLPRRKLCPLGQHREDGFVGLGMARAHEPDGDPRDPAQFHPGLQPHLGFGAATAMLQRIAVGFRRTGTPGVSGVGTA